jgi:hypothetical protein
MQSRAEALSFVIHRKVNFDQIVGRFVKSVGVDQSNKDIVITFTDDSIKRIPRTGSGITQDQVVLVSSAGYNTNGELQITLSTGQSFLLGVVQNPVDYQGAVGVGLYVGTQAGKHVFKPITTAQGTPMVNNVLPIAMAPGLPRDWTNYLEVAYESGNDDAVSANNWGYRRMTLKINNIPGASVNARSIVLPAGKYYVDAETLTMRGDVCRSAIFKQTPVGANPTTFTRLLESNPAYSWWFNQILAGEQEHLIRGVIELTDPVNQIGLATISSYGLSYMSWVWTGHMTRIWKIS